MATASQTLRWGRARYSQCQCPKHKKHKCCESPRFRSLRMCILSAAWQTSTSRPPSHGFAPQSFDWFALSRMITQQAPMARLLSPKTSVRNQESGQGEEKQSWFAPAALTGGGEQTTGHFPLHMKPMSRSTGVKSSCDQLDTFFLGLGTTGIAAAGQVRNGGRWGLRVELWQPRVVLKRRCLPSAPAPCLASAPLLILAR